MTPGRDVAELNANLGRSATGRPRPATRSRATESAIDAFQAAHGLPRPAQLLLGSVVFEPGAGAGDDA